MSRARHKKARGGAAKEHAKPEWEAGGQSNAAKEAEERKHGGHVHGEGEHPKHGAHKRARGGHVGGDEPHHMVKGHSMHHRHGMHVPGRKRGGGVGADMHPLTTASKIKLVTKGEIPEDADKSG